MVWEYAGSTEIFAPVYGFDDLSPESKIDLDGHEGSVAPEAAPHPSPRGA